MKPRSPLTEIDSHQLAAIWGISIMSLGKWRYIGLPHTTKRYPHRPYKAHFYNLYTIIGWLRNAIERHSSSPIVTNRATLEQKLTLTLSAIEQYKATQTLPSPPQHDMPKESTSPAPQPAATKAPKPFRAYPADRRMLTGDSVYTQLFFGRANGIAPELLNRPALVTKDEDNFGCVLVRFPDSEQVHSIPVCNLLLIRSVEDTPTLSIIADNYAYYITTKGVSEAIAAFWYGGKTNRMKDDARALAELNLDLLNKENA